MSIHRNQTATPQCPTVENIIEQRLEEVVTILGSTCRDNSALYEEVMSMVERALIRIALERSQNVKKTAALFLGINRNTLHSKMNKLGLDNDTPGR
ncbi:MAG: hypothetical protein M0Q23_07240 [Syntrophales bacterium]|jgi:DNA-binding protein Fis|nr:hypothetical protein [Syntrophales bacterium]MCK9528418.1 hypothetical protein [Syntrophales bacterium]MDX9922441.1 helix-turn-helix domain-containing protein [Syntrophales bacterium]